MILTNNVAFYVGKRIFKIGSVYPEIATLQILPLYKSDIDEPF